MRTYLYKLTMYVKVSAHNEEEAEELVLDNYKDFTEMYLRGRGEMERWMKVLTINQRDLVALYCLHMGIHTPSNIKKQIEEYEEIREIVNLCCEEIERFNDDKTVHRP